MQLRTLATLLLAATALTAPARALTFNLVDTGGAPVGSQAYNGFQQAAAQWSNLFSDPVEVTLQIGFSNLGGSILGQASSTQYNVPLLTDLAYLNADAHSTVDSQYLNSVFSRTSFFNNEAYIYFIRNTADGGLFYDSNTSYNNSHILMNQATMRATGIYASSGGGADATIAFNNQFTFDFDRSNGIDPWAIDFVGVASHEIGHALGFDSGLTGMEYYIGNGPYASQAVYYGYDFDYWNEWKPLDLVRYNFANQASYQYGWMDATVGGFPYLSLDNGYSVMGYMASGVYNNWYSNWAGQPSHWLDNAGYGLMDPTLGSGEFGAISVLDRDALDMIGWDVFVPEPSLPAFWEAL